MKINKLQINAFGNIENKEIELKSGINVIYGKNETGKSTLLKFIVDTLYGISKNKRGKEFSDYDRYKPWNTEEFSGKITYTLDNDKKYEVFRDFNKKNPTLYDEELNDISKEFTIDKTNGNLFFTEQTKIDENTFLSTLVSPQQEVRLEKQDQNVLVQRLANLAGTGEDNVSYKKALDKINKRQIEEIGTTRSQGRPINIVKEEQFKLQDEIGELEEYKQKQYEIEDEKQKLEEKLQQNEEKLQQIKQIVRLEQNDKLEKQRTIFNQNIINSNNEKIENLKTEKIKLEEKLVELNDAGNIKIKKNNTYLISAIIAIISAISAIFLRENNVALIASIVVFLLALTLTFILFAFNRKNAKKQNEGKIKNNNKKQEINGEIEKINSQIELLQKNNNEQEHELAKQNNMENVELQNKKDELLKKYGNDIIKYLEEPNELEAYINKIKLQIHSLELDKNNIAPKLEKLAQMEEELEELNEREKDLLNENEAIELAKQMLEIAYVKMKENVTPKFTENLSKNIEKISNGKYKNVRINDEEGIIVEKENGEYVSCEKLSFRNNRSVIYIFKIWCYKRNF